MIDRLQFTASDNGIAILILLVFSILGAKKATIISNWWNPVRSLQICLLVWTVHTTIGALVMKLPGQQVL